ncbi:MAG: type II toxin-antitoxin system VapC family toxin [Candidatus Bathyarchaeota archaeon]|nr:MAG: type II toxin-antitoxin system VapC family toxin [Candidatus Bathyarchaeota archaeon]
MRFVDSNVFLHAFLKPRRELTEAEKSVKGESKEIVERIEEGEEVATTAIHLSEVINIVESGLGLTESLGFLSWAISKANIEVHPTAIEDYEGALPLARDNGVSANDALAFLLMRGIGLREIYSFDRHFNQLKEITRLPSE